MLLAYAPAYIPIVSALQDEEHNEITPVNKIRCRHAKPCNNIDNTVAGDNADCVRR